MGVERIADARDIRLLDEWQRDFPLESRPFIRIGAALGCSEAEVLRRLATHVADGRVSRVGATCAPNTISASTLAAVAAPDSRIDVIAAIIGVQPGVNHVYQRENRWNLWFVATGPDRAHVNASLAAIARATGLRVLNAPLVRPFNVDLGFRLDGSGTPLPPKRAVDATAIEPGDREILQALTAGMPIVARPYRQIGALLARSEREVIARVAALTHAGIISRLGVIVRHRALGWSSNAMVVWDIPEERIESAGPALAAFPGVTLCYERRPEPVLWPYRLYCMIHAKSRSRAMDVLAGAAELPDLRDAPRRVLFSSRCFKQTGAMIAPAPETVT
ncbi:siroheme decarboxylase subunit beta [Tropicimonas marinistellae]|uniref:siroheme decarboxylase subunit beta n=1 Tax=Tropicimonas marinistellae TaxID=1739787 RepID=UPI0008366D27|nr:AsnC family transcriptional regulator [Tropicimonas marinistellae]